MDNKLKQSLLSVPEVKLVAGDEQTDQIEQGLAVAGQIVPWAQPVIYLSSTLPTTTSDSLSTLYTHATACQLRVVSRRLIDSFLSRRMTFAPVRLCRRIPLIYIYI